MLIEILALIAGILAGTISGLLPGIHINMVSVFLVSSSAFLLSFLSPITLVVFIVAMSITHTFIDFIPSIFLGSPDEDTALSVLPGHELLLKGNGYKAVIYALYGSILALPIILLLTPVFIFIMPIIFSYLKFVMFFILVLASFYLILKEQNSKLVAFLVFILSGFLGLATLSLPLKESLLPLLSGLFGSSSLITSIMKKTKLPKQKIPTLSKLKPDKQEIKDSVLASVLSSPLCSFLPALGSSQAAVIGSDLLGKIKRETFLILLGSINTIIMALSFVTLYSIGKTRTGSAVAVEKILPSFSFSSLAIILLAIILSSIIAFFLGIFLAKFFSRNITKISYSKLSVFILFFISIIVLIFSGFLGFLVFLVSTFAGLFAILSGVRRAHLLGCLMLPSILLYLPF